ncbi:hypothetical protein DFH06DRAFT_1343345 [Mycena polygramma]|nr:hypothetical protein DFH06DRAFT_1343345 [Mycena polygramma]
MFPSPMDAFVLTAGSRSVCFGCGKSGGPPLKQCSGCRVTRYCSPLCQISHWPSHRQLCLGRETLLTSDDAAANVPPDMLRFLKWMDRWHLSVFQWAVFSADLAHQSNDYLSHNCFILLMDAQPVDRASSMDTMYTPVQSGMRMDEAIVSEIRRFPVVDRRERLIRDFKRARSGPAVIRAIVMTATCYTVQSFDLHDLFSDRQLALFSVSSSPQARSLSTQLKWDHLEKFSGSVASGIVQSAEFILEAAVVDIEASADL